MREDGYNDGPEGVERMERDIFNRSGIRGPWRIGWELHLVRDSFEGEELSREVIANGYADSREAAEVASKKAIERESAKRWPIDWTDT